MSFPFRALLAAAVLCTAPFSLRAQSGTPEPMKPFANPDPRLAQIHAKMSRANTPGGVALSPDATLLAWTLGGREGQVLHLTDLAHPEPAKDRLISPNSDTACSNYAPVWSPDSKTLAFTSSCTGKEAKPGQPQIFLWTRETGQVTQLTHLTGIFQQAAFSPDGQELAFLFVENASRSAGALAAMKPWSGVIGEDGVEVQRVWETDTFTGQGKWITPANLHVYEFGWAPDSQSITFVGANPPGENNWWVAKLYTERLISPPAVVFDPNTTHSALHGLQIAVPRWSPDGKRIAFIGGLMSDQGSTGGDIWTVPATGGEPTDVTPGIDGSPAYLGWDSANILGFTEDRRGHSLLVAINVDRKSELGHIDLGEANITGGPIKMAVSAAKNQTVAFVKSGHDIPPEIYVGSAVLKQITHLNDGAKPAARVESVEWTNEGFHVQGWLTYPADFDPAKKYPLIVTVHGGPSASASALWGGSVWSQLGYFVFAPNPRGSFGQGEKFTAANIKDFGYGDLRDIEAGMDAIEARIPAIDKSREGLMGWSYGGFMTMFGVTQTTRFKAAVAGAGLSDWLSYYGENSIDQWMVPFFGATVYDDPAVYAKSSAINFIKNVKTPTLVVVGDRDGECPAPQSFEFWHALRAEGVKTQLVVYPNEGHGFRDPAHMRDLEAREVAWFEENMPAQNMPAHSTPAK
jgi:dipeptidyl aminopeptidase/acylaminoacyl peptidase